VLGPDQTVLIFLDFWVSGVKNEKGITRKIGTDPLHVIITLLVIQKLDFAPHPCLHHRKHAMQNVYQKVPNDVV